MRMSYGGDQLWLGDKKGLIHLVDATDGDFNLVQVSNLNSILDFLKCLKCLRVNSRCHNFSRSKFGKDSKKILNIPQNLTEKENFLV